MPPKISRRTFVSGTIRLAVVSPLVTLDPREGTTATQPAARFARRDRETLRAAADAIIPADGRMPAASAVGAVRYVERIAATDPKLRDLLVDGLRLLDARSAEAELKLRPTRVGFAALAAEQQVALLAQFENTQLTQPFFAALRDIVYEAYYTQPRVWKLIGYNFRSGRRPTARLEPFDERQLARVRALPLLYRRVP